MDTLGEFVYVEGDGTAASNTYLAANDNNSSGERSTVGVGGGGATGTGTATPPARGELGGGADDYRTTATDVRGERNESVRGVVLTASTYLTHLASEADRRTREVTEAIDITFESLKKDIITMLDAKQCLLRSEAETYLQASFNKLKFLNTDFLLEQKLLFPKERITFEMRNALRDISLYHGAHILDLPIGILASVMQFLPPQSVLACRLVCYQFWQSAQKAFSSDGCCSIELFKFPGSDTVVSPAMDFEFHINKTPDGSLGVNIFVSKKKLYAHPKQVTLQITGDVSADFNLVFSRQQLCEMSHGSSSAQAWVVPEARHAKHIVIAASVRDTTTISRPPGISGLQPPTSKL
ncbi:hypothetical protein Pelo_577 [Pelomyxa schiedti]|nr:hypothetical protein Pelo_577 [Pelomyxa schiedti]